MVRNGALTVINNKIFLDDQLSDEDFEHAVKICTCRIEKDPIQYVLAKDDDEGKKFTPIEVAEHLLRNMARIATHNQVTSSKLPCVLSVPSYFSPHSRKILAESANNAGFDILQIINESVAPILAYDIGGKDETMNVLVFRIGDESTDVTLYNVHNGLYELIERVHKKNMGGKLITDLLADYIAKEFYQKYKLDPRESRRVMIKLAQQAENSKHVLSTVQSAHIFVESLMDGVDWSQNLSRARFENLIQPLLNTFIDATVKEVMKKVPEDVKVDKVILCGGTMKIPKLQSMVAGLFPEAEILTKFNSDEVIAIGCAKQANLVTKIWDHNYEHLTMKVELLATDVGIDDQVIFKKGSAVSTEHKVKLPVDKNSKDFTFKLYEIDADGSKHLVQDVKMTKPKESANEVEIVARLTLAGVEFAFV